MKTLSHRVGKLINEYTQKIEATEKQLALLKQEREEIRKETDHETREMGLDWNNKQQGIANAKQLAYIQARTDLDSLLSFPYPAYDPLELEPVEEAAPSTTDFNKDDWTVFTAVLNGVADGYQTDEVVAEVMQSFPHDDDNDALKRINRLVGAGLLKHEKYKDKGIGIVNQISVIDFPVISSQTSREIFPKDRGYAYNKVARGNGCVAVLLEEYKKRARLGMGATKPFYAKSFGNEVFYSSVGVIDLNPQYDKDATHVVYFQ